MKIVTKTVTYQGQEKIPRNPLAIVGITEKGGVHLFPVFNADLMRGSRIQFVIWLREPTPDERAAVLPALS